MIHLQPRTFARALVSLSKEIKTEVSGLQILRFGQPSEYVLVSILALVSSLLFFVV